MGIREAFYFGESLVRQDTVSLSNGYHSQQTLGLYLE
jgi:hypothetical protein